MAYCDSFSYYDKLMTFVSTLRTISSPNFTKNLYEGQILTLTRPDQLPIKSENDLYANVDKL